MCEHAHAVGRDCEIITARPAPACPSSQPHGENPACLAFPGLPCSQGNKKNRSCWSWKEEGIGLLKEEQILNSGGKKGVEGAGSYWPRRLKSGSGGRRNTQEIARQDGDRALTGSRALQVGSLLLP